MPGSKETLVTKNKSLFKKSLKRDGYADIFKHGRHVHLAYSQFSINIKTHYNLHFPIQRTQVKYSYRNDWINSTLKKEIMERERLFIYQKELSNLREQR